MVVYIDNNRDNNRDNNYASNQEMKDDILKLLKNNPLLTISSLAKKLNVNRIYLSGYLQALEDQKKIKSKLIGPAKVYLRNNGK